MKFKPPELPINPSSSQWKWWRKCFVEGLVINEVTEDAHKLTILRTQAGSDLYTLLEPATTFEDALTLLDEQFHTPTRILYSRHQLLSCSQKPNESMIDFIKRLKLLVQQCECTAINASEHQNLLLRDALVAGITSDNIRARLLELDDSKASLEDCIRLASAIEISNDYSRTFNSKNQLEETPVVAVTENIELSTNNAIQKPFSNKLCYFCGRCFHTRDKCPAKSSSCHQCGKKGHWGKVCRSMKSKNSNSTSATLTMCTIEINQPMKVLYSKVSINEGPEIEAMIDSGSTNSFITMGLAKKLKLQIIKNYATTRMADNSISRTCGQVNANVRLDNTIHCVLLTVVNSLVTDLIIGMDILGLHDTVELKTGGSLPKLTCASLNPMKIQPPELFSSGLSDNMIPITTKSRYIQPKDREFMRKEVENLLESNIIEKSSSPWRAQAFVVRGSKPRMVIDYSETVNLFTNLDAYPFTNIESILNNVAENHFFSKIDLKSAYHQEPIKEKDLPFTAFETNGELYQFTRLPFGLTNAVPAFQRIMDNLIKENKLSKTYPYLDDVTICGSTIEEHDKNLQKFLDVAKKIGLTLNMSKCIFRTQKIQILGHVVENGTKRPDPERLEALLKFPTPATHSQLNRLVGFFAYNAKWIQDYSNKIQPLMKAQKLKQFPLSTEVLECIDTLKSDISNSILTIPEPKAGPILLETDASGIAVAAVLSQAERPIAFFSRTLSTSEQKQSTVEREAMAIIEATRKWNYYLQTWPTLIKTDQKAISYIFSKQKSRIKNDKLARWRLELSELNYDIVYRKGTENTYADSLTRSTMATQETYNLQDIHSSLAHPGVTRFWEYIQRHNLPFTLQEVREITAQCSTCLECKPKFFKPPNAANLIKSTRPYERLNLDIMGPKTPAYKTGYQFILTIIDEYSRFPFAFALKDTTTETILSCLRQLFSLFGTPNFIHSDRGSQFMSEEFDTVLLRWGISHSRTTPYNPRCNGQVERYNGVIWKSVKCLLHSRGLPQSMWQTVLQDALAANRCLICTATNETPHSRFFAFSRKGTQGYHLPEWLSAGQPAYFKVHVRNKEDPLVKQVKIRQVINPHFARIEQENGRVDTVSTRHLSPGKRIEVDESEETTNKNEPDEIQTELLSDNGTGENHRDSSNEINPRRPIRNRRPPDRLQIQW